MGTRVIMRTSLSPWQPQYVSVDEVICYARRCHGYNLERALQRCVPRKMTQRRGRARDARCARLLVVPAERREDGGRVKRRCCWVRCGRDYALCPTDPRRHGQPEPSPATLRDQPPQSDRHGHWVHHQSWPHFGHQAPPSPSGPLRNRADHRQGKFRGC